MPALRSALYGLTALTLAACASTAPPPTAAEPVELTPREAELVSALASFTGAYDVSDAAMATAIRNAKGAPVGLIAYEDPSAAVRAGDTAAFVASIRIETVKRRTVESFPAMVLSIDQAAAGDYRGALDTLAPALADQSNSAMAGFLKAWYLALDGDTDAAIRAHREVTGRLPGLSGDLSLAALLDAVGRSDEALGVYSAITPTEIVAPEHDFDPQGLVFSHVQLVVSRKALLLRRLGRIEDAQKQYRKLAAAEPEQSTRYAAAIESLATGRGLDDEPISLPTAFSRALADYSLSLAYQRLIASVFMGERDRGYDDTKGAFDQMALLLDPANDGLRLAIYDGFYDEAMYDAALHVLSSAPEPSTELKMAEAAVLIRRNEFDSAETALDLAISLAEADDRLATSSQAMGLYALMENRSKALSLAAGLSELAETQAEKAAAFGMSSAIYDQFAEHDLALSKARLAVELDDTHDRRMILADRLAEAGQIDEGLTLMRNEALARPNDPYMLNSLGYYLVVHTDRLEEAFRVLARASNLAPTDPYIADSFGWVRYQMGDLSGAQKYIELSQKELAPNRHWEIEDHLGDIYWHQGDEAKAREAWTYALGEFPPEQEKAKIERKLETGLTEPTPEKRPLPDVSLGSDGQVERQDI